MKTNYLNLDDRGPVIRATEANLIGRAVESDFYTDLFGILEYVRDGWAGVRGPFGRLDEYPAERIIACRT